MLIKNFYRVEKLNLIDHSTLHAFININKNHEVFNGHFPNNPITPGVCMIQTIKEITENHLYSKLFLKNISSVKFTAIIDPNVNPNLVLELAFTETNDTIKVKNITKFTDGTIALKCNGTFIKHEELV